MLFFNFEGRVTTLGMDVYMTNKTKNEYLEAEEELRRCYGIPQGDTAAKRLAVVDERLWDVRVEANSAALSALAVAFKVTECPDYDDTLSAIEEALRAAKGLDAPSAKNVVDALRKEGVRKRSAATVEMRVMARRARRAADRERSGISDEQKLAFVLKEIREFRDSQGRSLDAIGCTDLVKALSKEFLL